jgi:hypothetical protein
MTGLGKFRNLEGNLTVAYDMSKGNLAGSGGTAVLNFEEIFTPADLERMINPFVEEIISVGIDGLDIDFIPVIRVSGFFNEIISASIDSLEVAFIHLDDLDP